MSHRRRLAWSLALLFAVNIAVISLAQQAQAATYRQGSTGEQVRIIQTKLKNWGYYDGAVDGIFGSGTAEEQPLLLIVAQRVGAEVEKLGQLVDLIKLFQKFSLQLLTFGYYEGLR
mgnify:CR=1 FL=1